MTCRLGSSGAGSSLTSVLHESGHDRATGSAIRALAEQAPARRFWRDPSRQIAHTPVDLRPARATRILSPEMSLEFDRQRGAKRREARMDFPADRRHAPRNSRRRQQSASGMTLVEIFGDRHGPRRWRPRSRRPGTRIVRQQQYFGPAYAVVLLGDDLFERSPRTWSTASRAATRRNSFCCEWSCRFRHMALPFTPRPSRCPRDAYCLCFNDFHQLSISDVPSLRAFDSFGAILHTNGQAESDDVYLYKPSNHMDLTAPGRNGLRMR